MIRRAFGIALAMACFAAFGTPEASAQQGPGQPQDWQRFYYYPYVYYPHNFTPNIEYDSLYWRYPQERQIPVYRSDWYNSYPNRRPYHSGHHFYLDVF